MKKTLDRIVKTAATEDVVKMEINRDDDLKTSMFLQNET